MVSDICKQRIALCQASLACMVDFTSRLMMEHLVPKLLACLPCLDIKAPSEQHQLLAAVLLFMTAARKMQDARCKQVCHLVLESASNKVQHV